MKIKKINKEHYVGKVYNIGTVPNHNYFANNMLVHNCYQSSTKEGKHASFEYLKEVIDSLSNSKCLEIAIGGGEPTTHQDFVKILQYIKSKNILVGFTTKNFDLHKSEEFKEIIFNCNSIAFSCLNKEDIKLVGQIKNRAEELFDENENYDTPPAFYVQLILELVNPKNLEEILTESWRNQLSTTFLGYKEFGFGKKYKPNKFYNNHEWIDIIKEHGYGVGVDSIIAKKWKDELIKRGARDIALTGEEGKFSCYIDAVKKTISKSSFIDESEPLDLSEKNIYKQFSKF